MSASKNGGPGGREPYGRSKSLTFPSTSAYSQQQQQNFNSDGLTNESNNAITSTTATFKSARREKGVIEKLLTSYGFVQCTERKGRFFFHYSEYKGNLTNLAIGDQVEFQESVDKRTGKPVAVLIVKLSDVASSSPTSQVEILSGKAVEEQSNGEYANLLDGMGRVTYEQGGETFFLPFALEDTEQGQKIGAGDKVTFYLSTDERNGNIRARRVRKQSYVGGVVCSMKDNYGFIERADVVKEIFFHFSEFDGEIDELNLGDDVQFGIQTRNNKDVAVGITKLPPGTVIFEDVAKDWRRGKIKKTLKMASLKKINDALAGRIVYETVTGSIEIPFGEKDPMGDYTMNVGDIVQFCIATDRRDGVQHATNIRLVDDTFIVTKEKREKGFVTTLKEGFGFIRCVDREARMFFHFSELLNTNQEVRVQDELEFTVIQDPTNPSRQVATRIRHLPSGTIDVSLTSCLEKHLGIVQKEAGNSRPLDPDPGIIMYEIEGTKQMIPYSCSIVDGNLPKLDEKVEFQISECQKNKTKVAINVKVISSKSTNRERGFVVTIKEGFGFIETADHEKEIYFHFSNYDGDVDRLDIGNEVEFSVCNKSGRISAENIKRIPNKINANNSSSSSGSGTVTSDNNSSSSPAHGSDDVITTSSATKTSPQQQLQHRMSCGENNACIYPFSIMSLVDKRETLMARGDSVRFQVGCRCGVKWAYRVASTRKFVQARIESLTETGGLLSYETDQGCKLTFSSKDAQNVSELAVGDEVEFVVLNNNGVKMAINVRKASDRPRPERLISRIKSVSDDQTQRVITIRQPRGPDGTKGFKLKRRFASSDTISSKERSSSRSRSTSDYCSGSSSGGSCGVTTSSNNSNNNNDMVCNGTNRSCSDVNNNVQEDLNDGKAKNATAAAVVADLNDVFEAGNEVN
ncbi:hypothetical protein HELRODRAFT_104068 [Helobdella robusta]|uniref:CSD domain-containing protein n=1 Tax=Helobdella robusta TaxID=6412 RepID=T1EDJ4_HELRO|nr:hypothetical protein HELRODRAFT_104068 [Helobdella robusta]ESN92067.1 hypothetical protein HELRODRAFT_104068 [Helobdella robusta]